MPPKNKDTKSTKPANTKPPTLINGLTKEELSKEQMEEHIAHLQEELDREREERNYFQLERDNVNNFWEITKRKLEEVNAKINVLNKATEDDEARHRVESKVYKQKMKHVQCEHQNTISELQADRLLSTEVLQKQQDHLEAELKKKMKAAMVDMRGFDNKTKIREMELEHTEEMAAAREDWERLLTETMARNEESAQLLQQELEGIGKNVTSEQELHWKSSTIIFKENQNQMIRDYLSYFDFEKEWAAIDQLKRDVKEKQMNLRELKEMKVSQQHENQLLTERGSELKRQIDILERKTKYPPGIKIATPSNALKKLRMDYEVLEQRFNKLQLERDELVKSVPQNIQSVQNKRDDMNRLLESKVQTLTDKLEKTQAQLHSVLSAPNLDHTAISEVTKKVKEIIVSRNSAIKELKFKIYLISKAHRDLLLTIETKQRVSCLLKDKASS